MCWIWTWEFYDNLDICAAAAAAAKSLQSCPTLCDPRDSSPPGSPVPGILQARTLEWVAISFSSAWKWKVKVKVKSCPTLATPWTAAHQAPPSTGFSRQKYWSGVPLPIIPPILYFCVAVHSWFELTQTMTSFYNWRVKLLLKGTGRRPICKKSTILVWYNSYSALYLLFLTIYAQC